MLYNYQSLSLNSFFLMAIKFIPVEKEQKPQMYKSYSLSIAFWQI